MSTAAPVEAGRETLSPTAAAEQLKNDRAVLIDVRAPAEFRAMHAEGAINCPFDSLAPAEISQHFAPDGRSVMLICRAGVRSMQALKKFRDAGIEQSVSVDGGTQAWNSAGLPVERGSKSIALDRQVRIMAGSLVLLGLAVGWFVHPAGYLLSGFIGAGLVFSGVTDTCGMGVMLSKMPWNQ